MTGEKKSFLSERFFVNCVSVGQKPNNKSKSSPGSTATEKKTAKVQFWMGGESQTDGQDLPPTPLCTPANPFPTVQPVSGLADPAQGQWEPGDHLTNHIQAESFLHLLWDLLFGATRGVSHLQKSLAVGEGTRWERELLCFLINHQSSHLLHSPVPKSLAWFSLKRMLWFSRLK